MFESEVQECRNRILEVLNFLQTEFLRVWIRRGGETKDVANALASLAVSAIDSLKAVILLCSYDDPHNADAMLRRFEEHFTWMLYLVFCDDGSLLKRWFENPLFVPTEKNHKIRSSVTNKTAGFFHANPVYDFKSNFDLFSRGSVHVTWSSVKHATTVAAVRHAALHPEEDADGSFRETLDKGRAVEFLGIVGPETGRFLEFLVKKLFKMPEFSEVSPGQDTLAEVARLTGIWWQKIDQHLREVEHW
jgi:hypothetical protein